MNESSVAAPRSKFQCWEWTLRILVLMALVVPRLLAWSSAGGLWRDEVHSVNIATGPADNLFFVLTNDSIPMCWQSLLRIWIAVFGSSDDSVRRLGLLIGLAVIPAIWWSARQFSVAFPWWLMVLLGLDPSLIIFGGEVRGYGLGIISFLILIGASWRTLKQPRAWRWIGLIPAALFAVQSSFTNCFLLAATFIPCGWVALRHGRFRVCLGFALTGILAAASMVPYALYVLPRFSDAVHAIHDPVSWFLPVRIFFEMYAYGGVTRGILGIVIGLAAFGELLRRLFFRASAQTDESVEDQDLVLFLPPFFWLGTAGIWFYIRFLGVQTDFWYHLPWLTLLAVTTQLSIELWSRQRPQRDLLMVSLATLACMLIFCEVAPRMRFRLTAVDLIARDLGQAVHAEDLIVVTPWYLGITFGRYYHGPAEWVSLPNVDHIDHHLGYQEQKARVMPLPTPLAIKDELAAIETVLSRGGKVWWIGPLKLLPAGVLPLILTGAPHPRYGWSESVYMSSWQQLAVARMQSIGVNVNEVAIVRPPGVSLRENPSVHMIEPSRARPPSAVVSGPERLPR